MQTNHDIDVHFYPGWTRKSITFTIDDGNIETDRKFLDIVKPAGILGTFNLHHLKKLTPEEYREFYRGYEIANHCRNHPLVFRENVEYKISDDKWDAETSDEHLLYRTETPDVYLMHISHHGNTNPAYAKPRGWHTITDPVNYMRFARESHEELEAVFGKGSVCGFAWPHGKQYNDGVKNQLMQMYTNVRKTGDLRDTTGFDLPADRSDWTYNAHNKTLLEVMELYEDYPDDGRLKFFSFGVHSVDFERGENWCDLQKFADKYGNRPEDYYYATVQEIFDYQDAVEKIEITNSEIKNPTDISLYIKVDGKRVILRQKAVYVL